MNLLMAVDELLPVCLQYVNLIICSACFMD